MRKGAPTIQRDVRKMAGNTVFKGRVLEAFIEDEDQMNLSGMVISACGGGGGCGGCGGGRPPQALLK